VESDEIYSTDVINSSLTITGCSPFKAARIGERDKLSYGKRKLTQLVDSSKEHMASALGLAPEELILNEDESSCKQCVDLDQLVVSMKEKCATSTRYTQQQILTLAPPSWSLKRISEEFGVSVRLAKQSRKLKLESGIFSEPKPKQGRKISNELIQKVLSFYEDDEISRVCPGMRDVVSVRIDSVKVVKQKRLLLCNLNEAYAEFKKLNPDIKLGLHVRW
jgi:hypothetical protein